MLNSSLSSLTSYKCKKDKASLLCKKDKDTSWYPSNPSADPQTENINTKDSQLRRLHMKRGKKSIFPSPTSSSLSRRFWSLQYFTESQSSWGRKGPMEMLQSNFHPQPQQQLEQVAQGCGQLDFKTSLWMETLHLKRHVTGFDQNHY